ncbi:MAG: toll/interleukin-1 receptor domain-containing protein [Kiritimatiellaeota bacterium]|nr:toll/interleukin-1 receptor domain-containing protein [Kiritimatiellota bacterium]
MATLKCKQCGGDIQATGKAYGTCGSCGVTSTLPSAADEQKANLFNRANNLRRQNDFDKAVAAYENILNLDASSAEAHWGVVLSKYGIEYVEEAGQRIPTCHRVQGDSILTDADYLAALGNAEDEYTRSLYEEEARAIAEIQKGILAISAKEPPYDIFICYKETTDGGSRTKDSALAQDLYYQLEKEKYRVFFSRISLESKLGRQYEPYIFNALNSAKVMLAVGTRKEHFEAVWVKNEWSRFLALMKRDRSRLLIPCYRDMDAYDLPEEMVMLQSQDMGRIGFAQDILHGIKKVVRDTMEGERPASRASAATAPAAPGVESLMKRAWLFLEDADWKQARDYFDKVLDISPEHAPAYIGKLCVEGRVQREDSLGESLIPISDTYLNNIQKADRFADSETRARLKKYLKQRWDRCCQNQYNRLVQAKNNASTETELRKLAGLFRDTDMHGYRDTAALAEECDALAVEVHYNRLVQAKSKASTEKDFQDLAVQFRSMNGYRDTAALAEECDALAPEVHYNELVQAENKASTERDCQNLAEQFRAMNGYRDSAERMAKWEKECRRLKEIREKETAAKAATETRRKMKRIMAFFLYIVAVITFIALTPDIPFLRWLITGIFSMCWVPGFFPKHKEKGKNTSLGCLVGVIILSMFLFVGTLSGESASANEKVQAFILVACLLASSILAAASQKE